MRAYGAEHLMESFNWPGRIPEPDPVHVKIELALDAGMDISEAIAALDELDGDTDLEPEESDHSEDPSGNTPDCYFGENICVTEQCNLGHFHEVDRLRVA